MATVVYSPSSTDILHKVEVDMITRRAITDPIHIVQYDDRLPVLEISLFSGDVPYVCPSGSNVSVRYEKPDGKVVYNPVLGWNSGRTKIYVQVTIQMTTAFGEANAVLEIASGTMRGGSANFAVIVERNPVQEGAIVSTDEVINLQDYVIQAANSANRASSSAAAAAGSANTARSEANRAHDEAVKSANSAADSASARDRAIASANTAKNEADRSKQEADRSAAQVDLAAAEAQKSEDFSDLSRSYAEGTNDEIRPNDSVDNSKFYSNLAKTLVEEAQKLLDQAQKIVEAATKGALIPAGTVPFEDLPENPPVGYMYNISTDFTTDTRFEEGAGVFYRAGANVYRTEFGTWDVMIGTQVTGVKGNEESNYRVGNVNITPANIGAVPIAGDISRNTVAFTEPTPITDLTSKDSIATAFGKLLGMTKGANGNIPNMIQEVSNNTPLMGSKKLSSSGWYRIAKFNHHTGTYGLSFILMLSRSYENEPNESYILTFTQNSQSWNFGVLSAQVETQLLTQIRITKDANNDTYIEIFYDANTQNSVAYTLVYSTSQRNEGGENLNFLVSPGGIPVLYSYNIPIVSDLNSISSNKALKMWTISEWKEIGGTFDGTWGSIIRFQGFSYPGHFVGDTYFIAIVSAGNSRTPIRLFSGQQVNGQTEAEWSPVSSVAELDDHMKTMRYLTTGATDAWNTGVDHAATIINNWSKFPINIPFIYKVYDDNQFPCFGFCYDNGKYGSVFYITAFGHIGVVFCDNGNFTSRLL